MKAKTKAGVTRLGVGRRGVSLSIAVLAVVLGLFSLLPPGDFLVAATSYGDWTPTPRLLNRHFQSVMAVTLDGPNCRSGRPKQYCGKVLILGNAAFDQNAPAELFDPGTKTFSATTPGHPPHNEVASVLLDGSPCHSASPPDYCGDVLVVKSSSSDRYDPDTETWSETPIPFSEPHFFQVKNNTALGPIEGPACRGSAPPVTVPGHDWQRFCGGVAALGGSAIGLGPRNFSVHLYVPAEDEWVEVKPMPDSRKLAHAALLDGPPCHTSQPPLFCGKILVAGGGESFGGALNPLLTAWLYDPFTDTWSSAGSTAHPHVNHTLTRLHTQACEQPGPPAYCGKILITGGFPGSSFSEIYDPATNAWAPAIPMAEGRGFHTATLLPNGTVVAAGGFANVSTNEDSKSSNTAEIFDPTANGGLGAWTSTAPMNYRRVFHGEEALADGTLLVAGGSDHWDEPSEDAGWTAEIYRPRLADISVSGTDFPDPASVGAALTYEISVRNNGPTTAAAVELTDTLPQGVVLRSVSASRGSCRPEIGKVLCSLGDLEAGASANATLEVVPAQASSEELTLTNTATVFSIVVDPDQSNNSTTMTTTLSPLFKRTSSSPPPPVVSGLSEPCGPEAGGTSVRIFGSHFSGAAIVKFGDVGLFAPDDFTVRSDDEIVARAPAHAPGEVNVTVSTPSGTSASSSQSKFTYPCASGAGTPPERHDPAEPAAANLQAGQKAPVLAPPGGSGFSPGASTAPVSAPSLQPVTLSQPASAPGQTSSPAGSFVSVPGFTVQPAGAAQPVGLASVPEEESKVAVARQYRMSRMDESGASSLFGALGLFMICAITVLAMRESRSPPVPSGALSFAYVRQ